MAGNLVHFELPAADAERAKAFWSGLFGWSFQPWTGPVEYHMTDGIQPGGAVYPADDPGSGPVVYFDTDDIDTSLARLRELGGSVATGKSPIPGVGWYAHCADTEGNRFGIFQSDDSVPAPG
jgi:predicted enzyme related to lactoylglutathione lyase